MTRKKTSEAHSPQSLRAACERIEALLVTPRRTADEMERASIETLQIDYQSSLENAMKGLSLWEHGCQIALTDELHRRGAFRAADQAMTEELHRRGAFRAGESAAKKPRKKKQGDSQ